MKFRKKPVIVDAILWDETWYTLNLLKSMGMVAGYHGMQTPVENWVRDLHIKTLEGEMIATKGDWIIKGVAGEFYPCKPDIFLQTYEPE